MRNWTAIDQQAESAGIAERRLRQYQDRHNYKAILYNTVARHNQIPAIIVKTKQHKIKHNTKCKVSKFQLHTFSL